jgi:anti-anti-sigma factor
LKQVVSPRRVTAYQLEPQATEDERYILVSVGGELDLTNARDFEARLETLARNESGLLLDLRRVAFIDSAAVHVLFKLAHRLGKERFGLVFEPESAITRTLEVVGMHDVATTGGSVDELAAVLS